MIGMFIYTFTLSSGYIAVVYVTSSLLGFFMTGYLPVGWVKSFEVFEVLKYNCAYSFFQIWICSRTHISRTRRHFVRTSKCSSTGMDLYFLANLPCYPSIMQTFSFQVFGITFTMLYAELLNNYGDITANITMSVMLIIGTIVTAIIKSDLRRQAAQQVTNSAA